MSVTIEELEKRIARLEALVKEHLPCPHEKPKESWDACSDWYCPDCDASWSGGQQHGPKFQVVSVRR